MGLETGTYISDLIATNPVGATDDRATADDHLRLIKAVLKTTFPNINGAVTPTPAQLNVLAGTFIQTLLDDTDAETARATLGVYRITGSAAFSVSAGSTQDITFNHAIAGNHIIDWKFIFTGGSEANFGYSMCRSYDGAMKFMQGPGYASGATFPATPSNGDAVIRIGARSSGVCSGTLAWVAYRL